MTAQVAQVSQVSQAVPSIGSPALPLPEAIRPAVEIIARLSAERTRLRRELRELRDGRRTPSGAHARAASGAHARAPSGAQPRALSGAQPRTTPSLVAQRAAGPGSPSAVAAEPAPEAARAERDDLAAELARARAERDDLAAELARARAEREALARQGPAAAEALLATVARLERAVSRIEAGAPPAPPAAGPALQVQAAAPPVAAAPRTSQRRLGGFMGALLEDNLRLRGRGAANRAAAQATATSGDAGASAAVRRAAAPEATTTAVPRSGAAPRPGAPPAREQRALRMPESANPLAALVRTNLALRQAITTTRGEPRLRRAS